VDGFVVVDNVGVNY